AVGSANGKNPIPIIVPCHRVVNTGAGLGGYSGGLDVKRFLLTLEGAQWKESRKSRLALQMMA
ncbi:MAG: methylated-DNA--[protein]-cysteine S-methyltransferase, partial [Calditrichaeota bacterium]